MSGTGWPPPPAPPLVLVRLPDGRVVRVGADLAETLVKRTRGIARLHLPLLVLFRDAEVERVVVGQGGEAAVCLQHHRDFERLEADLDVEEVELLQDADVAQRGARETYPSRS